MSLKKDRSVWRTAKFRLTAIFTGISAAAFLFFSIFTWHFTKEALFGDVDSHLEELARKFEERCVVACGGWGGGTLKNVPGNILSKAARVVDGLEIKSVKTSEADGVPMYVFLGITKKMMYEIWVTGDGVLYMVSGTPLAPKMEFLAKEMDDEARLLGTDRFYFALFSPEGGIMSNSNLDAWGSLAKEPFQPSKLDTPETLLVRLPFGGFEARVLNHRLPGGLVLQIGANVAKEKEILSGLALKLLWLSFPLVALSAVCGWFVAGSVTSGVERVAAMADAITAGGDLGRRLPAGGGCGEIEDLALSFNAMLSRLEKSIREIEEVSDNIAHDLRTPLTRIKGIMETTVAASPKDVGEYREMCGEVLEECDRMVGIVDTMLEITRTDSGVAAMDLADVDVGELLDKARELFLPLAEAKELDLKSSGAPDGLTVRADKAKLQRAIANLIDNAVKYTPEGGSVEIGARSSDGRVEIFVADTGTGVPPKERKNVFKRFYRCDSSRSLPGNGLGLSLARAIARAHSGDIRLESGDGESVFTIELPAS